jgi:hypothetical protein
MKMELIQLFINAADAVLSQGRSPLRRLGTSAWSRLTGARASPLGRLTGDIEGRIVFDLDQVSGRARGQLFAGAELPESDDLRETV